MKYFSGQLEIDIFSNEFFSSKKNELIIPTNKTFEQHKHNTFPEA